VLKKRAQRLVIEQGTCGRPFLQGGHYTLAERPVQHGRLSSLMMPGARDERRFTRDGACRVDLPAGPPL